MKAGGRSYLRASRGSCDRAGGTYERAGAPGLPESEPELLGYLRASLSSSLMLLAAARTWSSRCFRSSAEARTRGEGTVSAASVRLPWVTAAEAAHTPW